MKKYLPLLLGLYFCETVNAQSAVYLNQIGKLVYELDNKGNKVPDYSHVGYKNSEVDIPFAPVKVIISPVQGDNVSNIQNAINQVGALSPDANGIRGAVLLKAGTYAVNDSIFLNKSGVIIRGEGNNTIIYASGNYQYSVLIAGGTSKATAVSNTSKKITNSYLPYGSNKVMVESGHNFLVGDQVFLQRKPNAAWLTLIGSDTLNNAANPTDVNWNTSEMTMNYMRKILAVNGNEITLDAPVVDAIDLTYAQGYLMKYTWINKVENIGIENLFFDSQYTSDTDENHGWKAINFDYVSNAWAKKVEVHHYGYSAVNIGDYGSFITVDSCKFIDPISQTIQSRKYSFSVNGQRNLVKNCYTSKGRHDYVVGSGATPGPNVFYNCVAVNQFADIGPHQKWATGLLFDKIIGDRDMNVQNRVNSGSGHGWTGAQVMYWNCTAPKFIIQSASGTANWAIGCTGNITAVGDYLKTAAFPGTVQSKNTPISFSLFERQLCERLELCDQVTPNKNSVNNYNYSLTVFPNPASESITLSCSDATGTFVYLYNIEGKNILQQKLNSSITTLDISTLTEGIYWIKVLGQNIEYSNKLVINKQ